METYEVQELDNFTIYIRINYTQIHFTQFVVLIPYMDILIGLNIIPHNELVQSEN
jgi:hypothetical protein